MLSVPETNIIAERVVLDEFSDAKSTFLEYYDAMGVLLRDDDAEILQLISNPGSGIWLARAGGVVAGCIAMKPLQGIQGAAECKRLYVRPAFRRQGVAEKLLALMERDAVNLGYLEIYLDSKCDFYAAIELYKRAGYSFCPRYNKNPQADVFMSKQLAA